MRVDRIVFLLTFIPVFENVIAVLSGGGAFTCGNLKRKYVFELASEANEINQLTNLVEAARSAIVKRPQNDGEPVKVIVAPEDFEEFLKKSIALRVYRAHSSRCVDSKTNEIFNEDRATSSTTSFSRSSSTPKIDPVFDEKKCRNLDTCNALSNKVATNESVPDSFENSSKVPPNNNQTIEKVSVSSSVRFGSTTSSSPRASNVATQQSKKTEPASKSKRKHFGKTSKCAAHRKANCKNNPVRNREVSGNQKARAKSKVKIPIGSTTVIPVNRIPPWKPWKTFATTTSKSLIIKKSRKILALAKNSVYFRGSGNTLSPLQLNSSERAFSERASLKEAKGRGAEHSRKIFATTNRPIAERSTTKFRTTRQSSVVKPTAATKSTLFSNTTIKKISAESAEKNKERNSKRNSRELKAAGKRSMCSLKIWNKTKRANWHYIRKDFGPYTPSGCHVIKITNLCESSASDGSETFAKPDEVPAANSDLLREAYPDDTRDEGRESNLEGSLSSLSIGASDSESLGPADFAEEPLSQFPGQEQIDYPSGTFDTKNLDEFLEIPGEGDEDIASIEIPDSLEAESPFNSFDQHGPEQSDAGSLSVSELPGESSGGLKLSKRPEEFSSLLPGSSNKPNSEQTSDAHPVDKTEFSVATSSSENSAAEYSPGSSEGEKGNDPIENHQREDGDEEKKMVGSSPSVAPKTELSEINSKTKYLKILSQPTKSVQEDKSVNNDGDDKTIVNDEENSEDEDDDYDGEDYDDTGENTAEIVDYVDDDGNSSRSDADDYELDED